MLKLAYQPLAFYVLVAIFAVSCLLWGLLAVLLFPLLSRRAGQSVGQFLIMAGFRYFIALMRASGIITCDLTALDVLRNQRTAHYRAQSSDVARRDVGYFSAAARRLHGESQSS